MPTISDYLQQVGANGAILAVSGLFVQFTSNSTSTNFVSTAKTTSTGFFTINNIPAGSYTVGTGATSTGTFTPTAQTNYFIGADVGSSNTFLQNQTISPGSASHALTVANSNNQQFGGSEIDLQQTTTALPNPGHAMWSMFCDRSAATGVPSNTRWFLRRQSADGTIIQDYIAVDSSGTIRIGDDFMFSQGSPTPGLNGVGVGRLFSGIQGPSASPTLGSLQPGIASQTITGNDTRIAIIITTTSASPPPAFTNIFNVNYGASYGSIPYIVWAVSGTSFSNGITNLYVQQFGSASSFNVQNQTAMPTSQTNSYTFLTMGAI